MTGQTSILVIQDGSWLPGSYLVKSLADHLVYVIDNSSRLLSESGPIFIKPDDILNYKTEIYSADVVINCSLSRKSRSPDQDKRVPRHTVTIADILSSKKDLLWIQLSPLNALETARKNIPISDQNCTPKDNPSLVNYEEWFATIRASFSMHCIYLSSLYSGLGENGIIYRIMDLLAKKALERLLLPLNYQNQLSFLHVNDAVLLIKNIIENRHLFCLDKGNSSRMIASEKEGMYAGELLSFISKEIDQASMQPLPRIVAQASTQLLSGVHFLTSGGKQPHWIVPIQEFLENATGIPATDRTAQMLQWQPKDSFCQTLPHLCKLFKEQDSEFICKNQILSAY